MSAWETVLIDLLSKVLHSYGKLESRYACIVRLVQDIRTHRICCPFCRRGVPQIARILVSRHEALIVGIMDICEKAEVESVIGGAKLNDELYIVVDWHDGIACGTLDRGWADRGANNLFSHLITLLFAAIA
jgi:hypothetical protein